MSPNEKEPNISVAHVMLRSLFNLFRVKFKMRKIALIKSTPVWLFSSEIKNIKVEYLLITHQFNDYYNNGSRNNA